MTRAAKGAPTRLNISALRDAAAGRVEFPNQLQPTDVPHIRRCFAAGLVEVVSRATLRLTPAGISALGIVEREHDDHCITMCPDDPSGCRIGHACWCSEDRPTP